MSENYKATLIISKRTKRIHTPGCMAVRMLKFENKIFTPDSALKEGLVSFPANFSSYGFKPCKLCNAQTGQSIFK